MIADFRTFVPDWELIKNRRFSLFALERIPRISRAQDMDILSSQDNLAGYKAAIEAVNMLNRAVPMMTTAAGSVMPAKILVVGIGVAGLQAIATAKRLGAVVFAHDIRPETREQAESLGARFVEPERLNETIAEADVVITAAGSPPRAPILFKQKEIGLLKAGSVLIDGFRQRRGTRFAGNLYHRKRCRRYRRQANGVAFARYRQPAVCQQSLQLFPSARQRSGRRPNPRFCRRRHQPHLHLLAGRKKGVSHE